MRVEKAALAGRPLLRRRAFVGVGLGALHAGLGLRRGWRASGAFYPLFGEQKSYQRGHRYHNCQQ